MCGICGCNQPGESFSMIRNGEKIVNDLRLIPTAVEANNSYLFDIPQKHTPSQNAEPNHVHSNYDHQSRIIQIEQDILNQNNLLAERNRGYFEAKNIATFNLVSSPGSGKTSILEKTLSDLKENIAFAVIEGDQQTSRDAQRIEATGTDVIQINTGKACHLDAQMVNSAIKELSLVDGSILFIENVGNLVCPSLFDLGENKRVVIISVTEGDDKAIKYPDMFLSSHLCLINKIDLLPYVDFDVALAKEFATRVNHHLEFIELSATTGEGINRWYEWLGQFVN